MASTPSGTNSCASTTRLAGSRAGRCRGFDGGRGSGLDTPVGWWPISVPLNFEFTRSVGFVIRNGRPIGTCFLVRVQSELRPEVDDWDHGYVVTAAHCAPPDGKDSEIWMGSAENRVVQGFKPQWQYQESGEDIAIAPWLPGDDKQHWSALRMYKDTTESMGIVGAHLGSEVHYIGLLAPVESMATRLQPMVRTANLGAMDVHDVEYHDRGASWVAHVAHIIDCRSHGGFSGSPVFLTAGYPGPLAEDLPAPWLEEEIAGELGGMYYFSALFGMLVGYGADAGVGIVLAVERIRQALSTGEVIAMRRKADKKRASTEPKML